MVKDFDRGVVEAVRSLYASDQNAKALFDHSAAREKDASSTSIDRIAHVVGISRPEALALAKSLEHARCGQFVVGRRGWKSRFIWAYSCISLGKAASGQDSILQEPSDEAGTDSIAARQSNGELAVDGLTIADAKNALAASLGISPSNIEITIKV